MHVVTNPADPQSKATSAELKPLSLATDDDEGADATATRGDDFRNCAMALVAATRVGDPVIPSIDFVNPLKGPLLTCSKALVSVGYSIVRANGRVDKFEAYASNVSKADVSRTFIG